MKKIYLLLCLLTPFLGSTQAKAAWPAPATYTIGTSGNFTSITTAVSALNLLGTLTGAYIFEFQNTYNASTVETFPISIPSTLGTTAVNTITFRPQASVTTAITSSNKFGTIKFNGAKYVYFDGRAGGIGSSKNLTIENTDVTIYSTTASGASATAVINVASTTNLAVGMYVEVLSGTGYFGPSNTIQTINSSTQITVTATPLVAIANAAVITAGWTPAAITLTNGASKNAVRYCKLKSSNQTITSGTVFLSSAGGAGLGGNNFNTIAYNDIYEATTGTPVIGIYAEAFSSAGYYNDADTITYNNIYNFYKNASSYTSTGALLRCSSNWEVSYNSFFQTVTRTMVSGATIQSINITGLLDGSSAIVSQTNIGNNNLLQGNYIGGTSANAGGGALTCTGAGGFVGIGIFGGTTTKNIVTANFIQNINFTSTAVVVPRGIAMYLGSTDCTNNTIGSQAGNSITIQINAADANTVATMIHSGFSTFPNAGNILIDNNSIGGITVNSTSTLPAFRAIGIQGTPASFIISNNLINAVSSTSNFILRGIYTAANPTTTHNILSNTISNFTQSANGGGELVGIFTSSASSSKVTIQSNKIYNLSTASTNVAVPALVGIKLLSTNTTNIIEKDTIYALSATTSTGSAAVNAVGIYTTASSGGEIRRNMIYNISNANPSTSAIVTGFLPLGGNWTFANNMVSLSNGSISSAILLTGVYDATGAIGTRNYYYNSIYIGGASTADLYGSAIQFNCNSGGTALGVIKNNILVMARSRSSATQSFYDIANKTLFTSGITSDNNILNCSYSSIGLWGTTPITNDKDFTAWKTAVSGESSSYTAQYIPFKSSSTGNLHIDTADAAIAANAYESVVESRGVIVSGTSIDFDNDARPGPANSFRGGATAPDIGADEVDLTYTGDDTWNGSVSNVWTNGSNWSAGVPNSSTKVAIPYIASGVYPVITSSVNAKNIITGIGSLLTINSGGTLAISGVFQNNSTFTNNGTVNFNGATGQAFAGTGTITAMNNLIVNNAAGLVISKSFSLTGTLTPTSGVVSLYNDTITLKSTNSATASVGVAGGSFNYIGTGKFIVERYIPAHRAWRLLTSPTTAASGQTMNASWQEGATPKSPMGAEPVTSIYNPNPGYGTHISGGSVPNGFDQNTTGNPSVKYYTGTAWQNVTSSLYSTKVTDQRGYMIFVRGSRASDLSQGTSQIADNTTLRSNGQLTTGTVSIPVSGNTVVGNPYASAINFHTVALASGFSGDSYYLWDPALTGSYNVGAWVTFSYNGSSYDRTITDTSPINNYTGSISQNGVIESGAAFMVTAATGNLIFNENAKTIGVNNAMFRPVQTRVNLLAENNDGTVSVNDGILVTYADDASNEVNEKDALKVSNFNESFSSRRNDKLIAIERRKTIAETDTIFFNLSSVQLKNYQFEISPNGLQRDNLAAFLYDAYLNSITPISLIDTTRIKFSFNSTPASYHKERFKLVYKPSVKFLNVSAELKNSEIMINWTVDGEFDLDNYTIERSTDSINYFPIANQISGSNTDLSVSYSYRDIDIKNGDTYFYRIKSLSKAKVIAHSNAVKIAITKRSADMFVFPNPVRNNNIGLQLNGKPSGNYLITISTLKGRPVFSKKINYTSGASINIIPDNKLNNGVYFLTVTDANNISYTIKIVIVS